MQDGRYFRLHTSQIVLMLYTTVNIYKTVCQLLLLIHGSCFKSSMYGLSLYLWIRQRATKLRQASDIYSSLDNIGFSPSRRAFCRPHKSWYRAPHGFPPTSISTTKQPMLQTSLRFPYLD